jgi:hypothetical protein
MQDANGDGRDDAIVARARDLWVITPASDQGAGRVHRLSIAGAGCEQLFEHVFLQADSDPEIELALSCLRGTDLEPALDDHLTVCDVDLERGTLIPVSSLPVSYSSGFVVGDFNGDGVDDIAAGTFFVPTVFWGVPRP